MEPRFLHINMPKSKDWQEQWQRQLGSSDEEKKKKTTQLLDNKAINVKADK